MERAPWPLLVVSIFLSWPIAGIVQAAAPCQNNTVLDILRADPDTYLETRWVENIGGEIFLGDPIINTTIFAPTNDAVRKAAAEFVNITDLNPSTFGAGPEVTLAAYSVTQGNYSPENLTSIGSINTIAGMIWGEDFIVRVSESPDGELQFSGLMQNNTARVLSVTKACNGYVYKIDEMLRTTRTATEVPGKFGYGAQLLEIFVNGSNCQTTVAEEVTEVPEAAAWRNVWAEAGLSTQIGNKMLSATIFVPSNQGTLDSQIALGNATAATVLYNMVQGSWCPNELLAAGTKNSMLGDILGQNLPLQFSSDAAGNVVITGAYGTAKVLSNTTMCQSVVLFTDVPLQPPITLNIPVPAVLPTLPIRHINCHRAFSGRYTRLPPPPPAAIQTASAESTPQNSSSSSSALALGLGIGLGNAVLLLASAAAFFVWRKKQRPGCPAKVANKVPPKPTSDDESSDYPSDELLVAVVDGRELKVCQTHLDFKSLLPKCSTPRPLSTQA